MRSCCGWLCNVDAPGGGGVGVMPDLFVLRALDMQLAASSLGISILARGKADSSMHMKVAK